MVWSRAWTRSASAIRSPSASALPSVVGLLALGPEDEPCGGHTGGEPDQQKRMGRIEFISTPAFQGASAPATPWQVSFPPNAG